jgi:hypothetical protein
MLHLCCGCYQLLNLRVNLGCWLLNCVFLSTYCYVFFNNGGYKINSELSKLSKRNTAGVCFYLSGNLDGSNFCTIDGQAQILI